MLMTCDVICHSQLLSCDLPVLTWDLSAIPRDLLAAFSGPFFVLILFLASSEAVLLSLTCGHGLTSLSL